MRPGIYLLNITPVLAPIGGDPSRHQYVYINRNGEVGFTTGERATAVLLYKQKPDFADAACEIGHIELAAGLLAFTKLADAPHNVFNREAVTSYLSRLGIPHEVDKWGNVSVNRFASQSVTLDGGGA